MTTSGPEKSTLQPQTTSSSFGKADIPHDLDDLRVPDLLFGLKQNKAPIESMATQSQTGKSSLQPKAKLAGTENGKASDDPVNLQSSTSQGIQHISTLPIKSKKITAEQIGLWASMTQQERDAAGGWSAWAKLENINPRSARPYLTTEGLTANGTARLSKEGSPITVAQVDAWKSMSQQQRDSEGGWVNWAKKHNIKLSTAVRSLNNQGAAPHAVAVSGKGRGITSEQINSWEALTQQEKDAAGGWKMWAKSHGIGINSAGHALTNTGLRNIRKASGGSPITPDQIKAWGDMSQDQRDSTGGWIAWTQSQNIDIKTARTLLVNTGVTVVGRSRLFKEGGSITAEQIKAWGEMTQKQRDDAGGREAWAVSQGIRLGQIAQYISNEGITVKGRDKIADKKRSITAEQIKMWSAMPQQEKDQAGGWRQWAIAHDIDVMTVKRVLSNSGVLARGFKALDNSGVAITNAQMKMWADMTQEQRKAAGTPLDWAVSQGIRPSSAAHMLANNGLTSRGKQKLESSGGEPIKTNKVLIQEQRDGLKIASAQLKTWGEMTQQQRDAAGGALKWALSQGIRANVVKSLLTNKGLTARGLDKLDTVVKPQLKSGQKMTQEQSNNASGSEAGPVSQNSPTRIVAEGFPKPAPAIILPTAEPAKDALGTGAGAPLASKPQTASGSNTDAVRDDAQVSLFPVFSPLPLPNYSFTDYLLSPLPDIRGHEKAFDAPPPSSPSSDQR